MWNDSNDKIMEIMDCVDGKESLFPTRCPICGEKAGHLCIHRYDEHHGGIWVWCSRCFSFAHMSGIIPEWWENIPDIEAAQLEADPQYLDERHNAIDEWVNDLLRNRNKLA